jgi:hypothetical protein
VVGDAHQQHTLKERARGQLLDARAAEVRGGAKAAAGAGDELGEVVLNRSAPTDVDDETILICTRFEAGKQAGPDTIEHFMGGGTEGQASLANWLRGGFEMDRKGQWRRCYFNNNGRLVFGTGGLIIGPRESYYDFSF